MIKYWTKGSVICKKSIKIINDYLSVIDIILKLLFNTDI